MFDWLWCGKWILWIFWIGCDVGSGFCGYFGSVVMWAVDFMDILDWLWCGQWILRMCPIERAGCLRWKSILRMIQSTHSVYNVMCLFLIAMLFSLCDWNCGNYCVLFVEVCVGAHLDFAVRCIFPTHLSVAWSWWRGVELLWGNVCLGTWIRFGTELRSGKRVTQLRLCDENTPFTKSFRMSSVSNGAVGSPWISVRMFVNVDFLRKIDPRSVPFLPRLCLFDDLSSCSASPWIGT
jgi:hypothetical protein